MNASRSARRPAMRCARRPNHLALFEALRRSSPQQRAREYVHGERGAESYEFLFKMCAGHDRLHMAQMQEALRPRASASH